MNEFLELFDYNAWASRTIFDAVARLPEEQYFRDLKSSYGGVHGTLCHVVWAEQLWLHRWKKLPNPGVPQGADLKSLQDVCGRWETVERERAGYVSHLSDAQLDETRVVKPSTGPSCSDGGAPTGALFSTTTVVFTVAVPAPSRVTCWRMTGCT